MSLRHDLGTLLRLPDFRRFFAIRLLCQSGDGMFQAALATLFFFSPQSKGTPESIALALVVLLSPFTVIGPFVGGFLDRWPRRTTMVVSDAIRVTLTLAIITIILTIGMNPAVYALALAALSLNRFLLAALGASLPRVVERDELLLANAILPTIGAAATGLGAVTGLGVGLLFPEGQLRDAAMLGLAILLFTGSIIVTLGFPRTRLGPEPHDITTITVWTTLRELGAALRTVRHLRTPALALGVMAAMRLAYGSIFVASILMSRNLFGRGLELFGQIIAITAVGFAIAIVLTPIIVRRIGEGRWVMITMLTCAAAHILVVVHLSVLTMLIASFFLGLGTQGAKIAIDTIIQRETPDEYLGRTFTVYDMAFNLAFMGAGGLGALFLPLTGVNTVFFTMLGLVYLALALTGRYGFVSRVVDVSPPARVTAT